MCQLFLVYVMLILTYANRFRIDLTDSANGSCTRRAIDTAPRIVTSKSDNSSIANLDAEYTDAPAH